MTSQQQLDYDRIAAAIAYIRAHHTGQPSLDEVAARVHLSPHHFQRLFTRWAGVSPKQFLQYTTLEHAKQVLARSRATLLDAACETGLSGTGRLHDLFVSIEAMTPGEYRGGGAALTIRYGFAPGPFGELMAGATDKGLCFLAFSDDRAATLDDLRGRFPHASLTEADDPAHGQVFSFFTGRTEGPQAIRLHLKGTGFQLKVWEMLLKIPPGKLVAYGDLAERLERPGASRAVGTAVGDNPVSYLIPCHRVIRSSGELGGYHWGLPRKTALIAWESARTAGQATP